MTKKTVLKRTALIILIIIAAYLSGNGLSRSLDRKMPVQVISAGMELNVTTLSGLNTDTDALHFGKMVPGQRGWRNITISNGYDHKLFVMIRTGGSLAGWIRLSDNGFWLSPGRTANIGVIASVPQDADYGFYTGNLDAYLYRQVPKHGR